MECILSQGQGGGRGTGTSDILKGKWKEAENRPHSERFCDVALTVKFYCDCDVAKSLRMGPRYGVNLEVLVYQLEWIQVNHSLDKVE